MTRQELDFFYARASLGGENRRVERRLCETLITALRVIELYEHAPESMHLELEMLRLELEGVLPLFGEAEATDAPASLDSGNIWDQAFQRGSRLLMQAGRPGNAPGNAKNNR